MESPSSTAEATTRRIARLTGGLYLFHILAVFLMFYLRAPLITADPSSTATNILSNMAAYRLSVVASLLTTTSYVAVVGLLFVLFRHASYRLSFVAATFGLTGCAVGAVLTVTLLVPPLLLGGSLSAAAFSPDHLEAAASLTLRLGAQANSIAMTFFGTYCVLLGTLLLRTRLMPPLIGALLLLSGTCWLIDSLGSILLPELARSVRMYLMPVGAFGELTLAGWLAFKGISLAQSPQVHGIRSTAPTSDDPRAAPG